RQFWKTRKCKAYTGSNVRTFQLLQLAPDYCGTTFHANHRRSLTHPCDEMQGRKPTGCRRSVARSGVCAGRCRGPCRRRSRGRLTTAEVDPAASRIALTEALVSPLQ